MLNDINEKLAVVKTCILTDAVEPATIDAAMAFLSLTTISQPRNIKFYNTGMLVEFIVSRKDYPTETGAKITYPKCAVGLPDGRLSMMFLVPFHSKTTFDYAKSKSEFIGDQPSNFGEKR